MEEVGISCAYSFSVCYKKIHLVVLKRVLVVLLYPIYLWEKDGSVNCNLVELCKYSS